MVKKLEQITTNQNKIDSDLNVKSQELKQVLVDSYNWKKNCLIKESDWITGSVNPTTSRVTSPNQFLPSYVNIDTYLDFTLNPKFVPFVNVEFLTIKFK